MSGFASGDDPAFAVSYIGYTEDTANRTTYTFAGESFGAEHSARTIFVNVHWSSSATARTLSSATIGGVAATIHGQSSLADGISQGWGVAIISAAVPSGLTGTIAFTLNSGGNLGAIGVVRVANLTAIVDTATTSDTSTSPVNPSTTIDIAANGALVAAVTSSADSGAGNISWTGVTEQYEDLEAGAGGEAEETCYAGALSTGMSVQSNRPVSMSQTLAFGTSSAGLIAVSIR